MVQKGKLNLVNHTVYDWIKTYQDSKLAMSQFPEIIPAKSSVEIEVEWTAQKMNRSGKINYMLFGSRDRSFQIRASSKEGSELQIRFLNIMTSDHPIGSILHIGLNRKGAASFALTGMADEFELANA